ncbi:MAG: DUF3536 domain-containing protein [Deltaproteobacteria bacterium]|nr:DUF3536 domain-containing protein [Deltaproteobacteria bacterium]
MEKYICIHGHFYQPPRENPWIEAVDLQDSAYPYHDWNCRITAECYAPNAKSRILDEKNRIVHLVNNYSRISFNFGPTLLSWIEVNVPWVYEAILEADRESMKRCSGHGAALAQGYNHLILPLANHRDKVTQVLWGIRDFEHRFGRPPEGMWLPETAVDLETLDILAEQGILFTILAPHQAKSVRPIGEKEWRDAGKGKIDPTMAYSLTLPSGRSIALFFYNGGLSRAVAFENLLENGEMFARRLMEAFSKDRDHHQLVHIATDGESYGHHHRFGDMALAYALNIIEHDGSVRLTNYGEFLEKHPPTWEVKIAENTSWSCAHGVERWREHCGCHTGTHPEWNQRWRRPLREALDRLRDSLVPAFEEKAGIFLRDPWKARDDYIDIVLDRSPSTLAAFLERHGIRHLRPEETRVLLQLLELQRYALLMYTSCGWFFDELTGIETLQVLQYAGRVLQLAREALGMDLEGPFLEILGRAQSNLPEYGDGRQVFREFVEPAVADLHSVCAHYALSSLFRDYEEKARIYCYDVRREDQKAARSGKTRLLAGKAELTSRITTESARLVFCALHLGDHNMVCGIREFRDETAYQALLGEIFQAFEGGDVPSTIRRMDARFAPFTYTLKSLFRDEQRRILRLIMSPVLAEAENAYRQLYEYYGSMIRFLKATKNPIPRALSIAVEFVINADLKRAFEKRPLDPGRINDLLKEARLTGSSLKGETLEYALRKSLEAMAEDLSRSPRDLERLRELATALKILNTLPFQVNLWTIQNTCYDILEISYEAMKMKAEQGDKTAAEWMLNFSTLAKKLSIRLPEGT